MTKALIIFADGSKQDAHNLDDLQFRWYERRIYTYDDFKQVSQDGFAIRDVEADPEGYAQAVKWQNELKAQKMSIQAQLIILKAQFPYKVDYLAHSLQVRVTIQEIETRIIRLKTYIDLKKEAFEKKKYIQEERKRETINLHMEAKRERTLASVKEQHQNLELKGEKREKEFSKLSRENRELREQLINVQAEVIRLQNLLINQFKLSPDIVVIDNHMSNNGDVMPISELWKDVEGDEEETE